MSFNIIRHFPHVGVLRTYRVEITQNRWVKCTGEIDALNVSSNPPDIPFYRRFEEMEGVFTIRDVSGADYRNDPYCKYTKDVIEYLHVLWEYMGEGGRFPTRPPIAVDEARGFVEVQPCDEEITCPCLVKNLKDETCPICYEEIKDETEVITTYCSHAFHVRCLLPWLSKKNTCPTCRAVYPLHYSPLLNRQRRKRKHNML
ncbi:hypothetical protein P3S68_028570 [Capsicum galapagoense]